VDFLTEQNLSDTRTACIGISSLFELIPWPCDHSFM
jgi:hypothetical protein